MAPSKSQVGFYTDLCAQLIASDPLGATPQSSLKRDLLTLRQRIANEGLSFLTKTLPKLGKALDHGLVSLRFTPVEGFASTHRRSTPAFLQAYFNLIFSEDGSLLEEAPPSAVKHLRQVLFFAYKLELSYSPELEDKVISQFVKVDDELALVVLPEEDPILDLASRITENIFSGFDPRDILPRHGPGAVATGEKLEQKWLFSRLYNKIHQYYPYYDYYIAGGGRELLDRLDWYRSLERLESGTAKVVLVPKDSRGPRLISAEPLEYQWIQQGLGRKIASHLEMVNPYTKGRINFTSQEINRNLALTSSTSANFATLDLKEASDRVSLELVRRLFKGHPSLLRALEATRTTATRLPNGDIKTLNKFAPMGSSLCFPVEAYCFWVLIVAAAVHEARLPLEQAGKLTYVYGDDIIIPVSFVERSIRVLESVGLLVNRDKSCITGNFRESCGMDAFKGVSVTPTRLKSLFSDRPTDGTVLASYSAIANNLQSSYPSVSTLIWERLERIYGTIPYGTSHASYPCKVVASAEIAIRLNLKRFPAKVNRRYQRLEFWVKSVLPVRLESKLDGWPRLLKNHVVPSIGEPSNVVVPRSTYIKRGWRAVY